MGPQGTSRFARRVYLFFFLFYMGGWARRSQAQPVVDRLRQFVALTQDLAVRGYVALTSGSRAVARGARLIIFFVY